MHEVDTRWHCCSRLLEEWWLLLVECVWCTAALFTWWRSVSYSNRNREAVFHKSRFSHESLYMYRVVYVVLQFLQVSK